MQSPDIMKYSWIVQRCSCFVVCVVFACNNSLIFTAGSPGGNTGPERGADPRGGFRSSKNQRRDAGAHRAR